MAVNCALLDVSIVGIAPGSTSEYMPDCYRPLYGTAGDSTVAVEPPE